MPNSRAVIFLGIALSAFGVLASILELDDVIVAKLPVIEPYIEYIENAFLISLLILSLIGFFVLGSSVWEMIQEGKYAEKGPLRRRFQHFICQDVRADDLPHLMSIYTDTTPATTDLAVTRALYGKCRKGWKKIVDTRSGEIVGYFIVLPLTKAGEGAIKERSFSFASAESVHYFRKHNASRCSAYIGMIGARPKHNDARAFAVNRLVHFVNSQDFGRLYARAATDDGLRLLKRKKFTPYFPEDRPERGVIFTKAT